MLAHYAANFPIAMMNRGWLGPNVAVAQTLVFVWVTGCFLAAIALLTWLQFGDSNLGRLIHGVAICPRCSHEYGRPLLLGLNFGALRYERCPHCRKWHWTRPKSSTA